MPLFGNRLLARVLGHRSTTTLYKSGPGDPGATAAQPVGPPESRATPRARSAAPLIMAKLVPPGVNLPVGLVIPAEAVSPAPGNMADLPAAADPPAISASETLASQTGQRVSPQRVIQQEPADPAQAAPRPQTPSEPSTSRPSPAAQPRPAVQQQQDVQPAPAIQPPPAIQQSPAGQPPPAAQSTAGVQAPQTTQPDLPQPSQTVQPPDDLPPGVTGDSDFSWIDDSAWTSLKRFAEGHQEREIQRKAAEEALPPDPEQLARQAAKERTAAEIAQRQELARKGQLPRATVDYLPTDAVRQPPIAPAVQASPAPKTPETPAAAPVEPKVAPAPKPTPAPADPSAADPAPVQRTEQVQPAEQPLDQTPADLDPGSDAAGFQVDTSAAESVSPEVERPLQSESSVEDAPSQENELAPDVAPAVESSAVSEIPPSPELTPVTPTATSKPVQAKEITPAVQESPSPPAAESPATPPPDAPPGQRSLTEEIPAVDMAPVQAELVEKTIVPSASEGSSPTIQAAEAVPEPEVEEPGGFRRIIDAARSFLRRDDPAPPEQVPPESDSAPPIAEHAAPPAVATPAVQREIGEPSAPQAEQPAQEAITPLVEEAVASPGPAEPEFQADPAESIQRTTAEPTPPSPDTTPAPESTLPEPESTIPSPSVEQPLGPESMFAAPDIGPVDEIAPVSAPVADIQPAPTIPEITRQEEYQDAAVQSEPPPPPTPAASESISRQESQLSQPAEISSAEPPQQPTPESIPDSHREQSEPVSIDPGDAETLIQPVPLEAAFPVQELKPPKTITPPVTDSSPAAPAVQRKPAGDSDVIDAVHSATKDVDPLQSTESSIELITPRRPRPILHPQADPDQADVPPKPATELPPADQSPSQESLPTPPPATTPATIQKQPVQAPVLPPEQPSPTQPATPPDVAAPQPVQMKPAASPPPTTSSPTKMQAPAEPDVSSPPAGTADEPYLVPTPIGELPSDLWQMLGETPPSPAPVAQRRVASDASPPVQTEVSTRVVTEEFHSPDIQRTPAHSGDQAGRSDQTVGGGQEDEAGDEGEDGKKKDEVDVEELARQVYPEIRRRLQVDWERGRGRLY